MLASNPEAADEQPPVAAPQEPPPRRLLVTPAANHGPQILQDENRSEAVVKPSQSGMPRATEMLIDPRLKSQAPNNGLLDSLLEERPLTVHHRQAPPQRGRVPTTYYYRQETTSEPSYLLSGAVRQLSILGVHHGT